MKKLSLILLLLPSLLFAQKKHSSGNTIKIRKNTGKLYVAAIGGIWDNYDTITKAELLRAGKLQALTSDGDTAKVTGFTLSLAIQGSFIEQLSNNEYLTPQMINNIMQAPNGGYIIFAGVHCNLSGETRTLQTITLIIDSIHKRKADKKIPEFVATFRNYWYCFSIKSDSLIAIGKLNLLGNYPDSAKITGFTMDCSRHNSIFKYYSANECLTSEMIKILKSVPPGTVISFKDIRLTTPDKRTTTLNNIVIQIAH